MKVASLDQRIFLLRNFLSVHLLLKSFLPPSPPPPVSDIHRNLAVHGNKYHICHPMLSIVIEISVFISCGCDELSYLAWSTLLF